MSAFSGPIPRGNQPSSRNEYQHLYNTARWKRLRHHQLRTHPLCAMCRDQGRLTPASVADHKTPHKGDTTLFYDPDNLQSLCKACHDGAKQQLERIGTLRGCDINGVPLDPGHAWRK